MKTKIPDSESLFIFEQLRLIGVLTIILAVIPWASANFISSFAATEYVTHATLRTIEERDDTRVLRAYESARANPQDGVDLITEKNPEQSTRDSVLIVTAPSASVAIAQLETLINTMQTNFKKEGAGELYDLNSVHSASFVPNESTRLIYSVCRWLAILILFTGALIIFSRWRRTRLPKIAILGIAASCFTLLLICAEGSDYSQYVVYVPILVVPAGIIALLTWVTLRVRRAASWVEGRAEITKSEVEVTRHRFVGDPTKVTNKASVAYEFSVGVKSYQGDCISLGAAPADSVYETLKRYKVGTRVPVYYDPKNPEESVLERTPPVSLRALWIGALVILTIYAAVVFYCFSTLSLNEMLGELFPTLHHPVLVIMTGLLGLLSLSASIWNFRNPTTIDPWPMTKGKIVSSGVESYTETFSRDGDDKQVVFYKPLIEYKFAVEGHTYHSTVATSGGSEKSAEREVARYAKGTDVTVYYNPKDPGSSSLEEHTGAILNGRRSLIVAIVLLTVATYAAMH
jgi:hypothetical protein